MPVLVLVAVWSPMARVLALVPLVGRGPLVHADLLGSTLAERAVALSAQVAAEVIVIGDGPLERAPAPGALTTLVLPGDSARLVAALNAAEQVVMHDPLCPSAPERFVRELIGDGGRHARVAVRPVVDTVKATDRDVVLGTIDRERLRVVSSPVVATGSAFASLPDLHGALADPAVLVAGLRAVTTVELVIAPAETRRLQDSSDLRLVAAAEAVAHAVRERS